MWTAHPCGCPLCDVQITAAETSKLQENLLITIPADGLLPELKKTIKAPKGIKNKLPFGGVPAPVLQLGIGIPFDTEKPMITSGIRLGTQAATTRGFGLNEFKTVGELITKTLKGLSENPTDNSKIENEVKNEVITLTSSFPIYKNL